MYVVLFVCVGEKVGHDVVETNRRCLLSGSKASACPAAGMSRLLRPLRCARPHHAFPPPLQLIRLAQALGRSMVVPHPPCDSQWVGILETRRFRSDHELQALDAGELSLWPYYYDGFQVLGSCRAPALGTADSWGRR